MTQPTSTPKKRGAPLGNRNAQKHGAYTRRPPLASAPTLSQSPQELTHLSLSYEIAILRFYIEWSARIGVDIGNLAAVDDVTRLISMASMALARLVQTEIWLSQVTGNPVSSDKSEQVIQEFKKIISPKGKKAARPKTARSSPSQPASLEKLFTISPHLSPTIESLARQLGVPISVIADVPESDLTPHLQEN